MNYLTDSTMRGWDFLTGDVNFQQYGGSWVRHLWGSKYQVIELISMWDATGEEDQDKYSVELREVDIESSALAGAIESCGMSGFDYDSDPIAKVEALSSYGAYAPMGDWGGGNYTQLLLEAKREAKRLEKNLQYHKAQLDRPVNRIGSTALEYANGDTQSALIRGIASGSKEARLLGKISGLKDGDMDAIVGDNEAMTFSLTEIAKEDE